MQPRMRHLGKSRKEQKLEATHLKDAAIAAAEVQRMLPRVGGQAVQRRRQLKRRQLLACTSGFTEFARTIQHLWITLRWLACQFN